MRLPRYQHYKDSGVEWLGMVPDHWEVAALKTTVRIVGGSTPQSEVSSYWDGGILWATPADLSKCASSILEDTERTISADGLASCAAEIVPAGSIILSTRAPIGSLAIAGRPMCTNQGCKSLVPTESHGPYLAYLLGVSTAELNLRGRGTTFLELSAEALGTFKIPVPPKAEQIAIAAFIDQEARHIDDLVAQQERLVELLKEKRRAVISHAVTNGLNPDAPMKRASVDWMGTIPSHWTIKKLKRISPFITVGIVVNPTNFIADDGLPFLYGGDIREGIVDWEGARRIQPAMSASEPKTQLHAGDLVTVRVGAPGVTAVVPAACEGGNCASVMLIRRGDFNSEWLCHVMNARVVRFQVEVVQYGAAQEQFNIGHAVHFCVPVPPRSEQERIAEYIRAEVGRLESLVAESEKAARLLRERRAALISAAVTGHIDVRGYRETKAA